MSDCPHNTTVTAHTTPQLLLTQRHSYCSHNATVTGHTGPQLLLIQCHSYCPPRATGIANTTPQLLPTQRHSYCRHNQQANQSLPARVREIRSEKNPKANTASPAQPTVSFSVLSAADSRENQLWSVTADDIAWSTESPHTHTHYARMRIYKHTHAHYTHTPVSYTHLTLPTRR